MKKLNKVLFFLLLIMGYWLNADTAKVIGSNNHYKIIADDSNGSLSVNFIEMPDIKLIPYSENLKSANSMTSCVAVDNMPETFRIVWQAGDETIIGQLSINADKSIGIVPEENFKGVFIDTPLQYVVLPSRRVECVNYIPDAYPKGSKINIPADNLLLGLGANGNRMLVVATTKPEGNMSILRDNSAGFYRIDSALSADGISLAIFDVKNIWHKIELGEVELDKIVTLNWKPPFDAQWIIQLEECKSASVYHMAKASKPTVSYRALIGMYQRPLWQQNNEVKLMLDSKVSVASSGPALIYALEGKSGSTPYEFLESLYDKAEKRPVELVGQKRITVMIPKELATSVTDNACRGRDLVFEIFIKTGSFGQYAEMLSRHAENRLGLNTASEKQTLRFLDWSNNIKANFQEWRQKEKDNQKLLKYFDTLEEHVNIMDKALNSELKGKSPDDNIAHSLELSKKIKDLVHNNSGTERAVELYEYIVAMNYYMSLYERIGYHAGRGLRSIFRDASADAVVSEDACRYAYMIREQIRQLFDIIGGHEMLFPLRATITK